jgi:YbbR domain-containing protein
MKLKAKIPYILLSLVISLILWIYMVGVEQPEREETISGISVELEGHDQLYEDRGLIVISEDTPTVSLVVRGNMVNIAMLKTKKDDIRITADLTKITSTGEHNIAYEIESLPVDKVSILERDPYYITVKVDRVQTRPVEVICKNNGSIGEGYMAEDPIVTPEYLRISGPEEKINAIAYAEVVWSRKNQERTLKSDLEYVFRDSDGNIISGDGITADYDFVTVTVPIKKVRDIFLLVEIVEGGGAKEENIEYTVSPPVITIAGDPSKVDALNHLVVGRLELAKIISPGKLEFNIILDNDIENISGEDTCTVNITAITGIATREYTCDNITLINVPEGMNVGIVTKELKVRLRGKPETLDLIFSHNLRAVIDLEREALTADAKGRYSVGLDVYLDGYADVGIVGEYKAVIDVNTEEAQ